MNRLIIIFLLIITTPLFALEIWLNDNLFENYSSDSLEELSYYLPNVDKKGIYLKELLPLMENISSFKFISDDFILETDMSDTLFISIEEDGNLLHGESLGMIKLPDLLEIEGSKTGTEMLTIWMDEENSPLKREIDLFGKLHKIEIRFRIEKNLISLLEYNIFNNTIIPDLIIYNQEKLNSLSPLLKPLQKNEYIYEKDMPAFSVNERLLAVPFMLSRQIFLTGSSGGDNQFLTSDFGNINFMYPLFIRFGMGDIFDLESPAVKDSFYYLTSLYNQGIYKLSTDPEGDFISGQMNSFYGSSEFLEKLKYNLNNDEKYSLPQLGGENPPPLLKYKLLSIAEGSKHLIESEALINYLTAYGVQQRLDPQSGYLPYNRNTYSLLNESAAKKLLLEDLDKAVYLEPGDSWDKIRFVLPKVYRLIVTGRLTIEQGIAEIKNYMMNQNS